MKSNYDYFKINTYNEQKVMFSGKIYEYFFNEELIPVKLILTRSFIVIEHFNKKGSIFIQIKNITGIIWSKVSSEFVIQLKERKDLHFSIYLKRKEVIETILYILNKKAKKKINFYFLDEINLSDFVTDSDNLGKLPISKGKNLERSNLTYETFLHIAENFVRIKKRKSINTQMIYSQNKKGVTIEDFELLKLLGKGAHGKVILAEKRTSEKKKYAIKILKKEQILDSNRLEHTKAEKWVLSNGNHPFLVSLNACFQTKTKLYFVMEFMKGGELFQHLSRIKRFTEKQAKYIAACLVLALGHLHTKGYIYRDLKPENVLFDEKGYARLTDFGLVKFIKKTDKATTFCGTPEYLSPEIILDHGCNRPTDWWSLGILIYEMIFGIPCFYSQNIKKMYKNILTKRPKFPNYAPISEECKDFLKKLLKKNPANRLGTTADSLEIMNHPFFLDFDWSNLLVQNLKMPYDPLSKDINWIDNFSPSFTRQKPVDSICYIDPEILKKFKNEFEDFEYFDQSEDDSDNGGIVKKKIENASEKNSNDLILIDNSGIPKKKIMKFFNFPKKKEKIVNLKVDPFSIRTSNETSNYNSKEVSNKKIRSFKKNIKEEEEDKEDFDKVKKNLGKNLKNLEIKGKKIIEETLEQKRGSDESNNSKRVLTFDKDNFNEEDINDDNDFFLPSSFNDSKRNSAS